MISQSYSNRLTPDAPFLCVNIVDPLSGLGFENKAAQVDTAADRTVLPVSAIKALNLIEDGFAEFVGFGSEVQRLPLYIVDVYIHDLPFFRIRAIPGEGEPWILLGRDVLNRLRITLNGPDKTLEIG